MSDVTNVPLVEPVRYQRTVLAYHGLPSVAAIVSVGIFIGAYAIYPSYTLAAFGAAVPSAAVLWKWVAVGRQIERWGCPVCGEPFPKRLYLTTYPPRVCPVCGKVIRP